MEGAQENPGLLGQPPPTVPNGVRRRAEERGLGGLVDVRREVTTPEALVKGWGTAAVSFGIMWLLATLNLGALRVVAVFFFFLFFWGLVYGVRGLVVGSRVHYLYEGGIVRHRRSVVDVVAWPEVVRLRSVYNRRAQGSEGKVLGYRIEAQDGTSFAVPLVPVGGRDAFIDRIVDALRHHGRPIE